MLAAAALVALTVAAYSPAFSAGFVWDDDDHVTANATLRDVEGLKRIWFDLGAVPQYYPLVHTTFWLEYRAWGLDPLGYHAVNLSLHALAAWLLGLALVRLRVPGAWLAAALFAVHPVGVESVAWVTERKNVLSAVFYFAAALAYFRFAPPVAAALPARRGERRSLAPSRGSRWWYALALGLFLAALLSKTVTASLPAALLLVYWWKKGTLTRADALPLAPWFVFGLLAGSLTAWLERHHVGAQGEEWALSWADATLVAGRAVWFYAGKLAWPSNLTFVYPRWTIDAGAWWQWLFPVAALAVVAALWRARGRVGRGPLAAVLFFIGTLTPALGFFNVYPMRYSFVADHFQYLASVGVLVPMAAALARLRRRAAVPILLALAVLTWHQAHAYESLDTLWRDTLEKNPAAWLAHNNLGMLRRDQGRTAEAETHYRAALELRPQDADVNYNLANLLASTGRVDEAIGHYRRSLQSNPGLADAHNNLGAMLQGRGDLDAAVAHYRAALALEPARADTHSNMGTALLAMGRRAEAAAHFEEAVRLRPDHPRAGAQLRRLRAGWK
ncbi:MAG TPA: tetratricopeptide repeat protein [Vicinamibacterales bacterium]|nr:tetratricopeptide repeat protein [Vicinamibacterales bacterium]